MDKNLISITLENEDLSFINIPCEYIGFFQATPFVISIDRRFKAKMLCILDGEPFGNNEALEYLREYNRIMWVECNYEDGSKDRITVDWYSTVLYVKDGVNIYDPKYQNHNEYQRSKTNKHGDVFIEVSEHSELDRIFIDEVINADDYTVGELNK